MATTYIIFVTGLLTGLLLLFISLRYYRKFKDVKEISTLQIDNGDQNIYLNKGHYSIDILGGGDVKNFPLQILTQDQKAIKLNINTIKYRFIKKGIFGFNYFNFLILNNGYYTFAIYDPKSLLVKQFGPNMITASMQIPANQIKLVVKEYSSPGYMLLTIILSNIGAILLIFDVIFLLYKLKYLPNT